jgi:hypothetical protein
MPAETFGAARRGGKKMNPMWGASIGAGVSTVTAVGIRQMNAAKHPKLVAYSEGLGFVAGALPGVALLLLKKGKNKDAGYAAITAAFLSSGLRQVEMLAFPEKFAEAAMANAAVRGKLKAPALPATPTDSGGMGDAVIEPTQVLQGINGLGIVDIEPTTALQGYHESGSDMPQLVGASLDAANEHVQLVGGPPLSQHASHWGATLFAR